MKRNNKIGIQRIGATAQWAITPTLKKVESFNASVMELRRKRERKEMRR